MDSGNTESPSKRRLSGEVDTSLSSEDNTEQRKRVKVDTPSATEGEPDVKKEPAGNSAGDSPKSSVEASVKDSTGVVEIAESPLEAPPRVVTPVKKHTFGSTTSFGSTAFASALTGVNVFHTSTPTDTSVPETASATPTTSTFTNTSSDTPTGTPAATSFGTFGANSIFANAFKDTLNKPSFLDTASKDTQKDTADPEADLTGEAKDQFKQVELTKTTVATGEEEETAVLSTKARLFTLNLTKVSEGWKERGVGVLHLNTNNHTKRSRIVMRSNGLLRVIMNVPLVAHLEVSKGMESSLQSEKFLRVVSIDETGDPIQYAIKTARVEIRDDLYENVKRLIPEQ